MLFPRESGGPSATNRWKKGTKSALKKEYVKLKPVATTTKQARWGKRRSNVSY